MDNDALQGETSTVRTNDRGEISGKPVGAAEDDEPLSEAPIHEQNAPPETDTP
jgi:hypothetical protein